MSSSWLPSALDLTPRRELNKTEVDALLRRGATHFNDTCNCYGFGFSHGARTMRQGCLREEQRNPAAHLECTELVEELKLQRAELMALKPPPPPPPPLPAPERIDGFLSRVSFVTTAANAWNATIFYIPVDKTGCTSVMEFLPGGATCGVTPRFNRFGCTERARKCPGLCIWPCGTTLFPAPGQHDVRVPAVLGAWGKREGARPDGVQIVLSLRDPADRLLSASEPRTDARRPRTPQWIRCTQRTTRSSVAAPCVWRLHRSAFAFARGYGTHSGLAKAKNVSTAHVARGTWEDLGARRVMEMHAWSRAWHGRQMPLRSQSRFFFGADTAWDDPRISVLCTDTLEADTRRLRRAACFAPYAGAHEPFAHEHRTYNASVRASPRASGGYNISAAARALIYKLFPEEKELHDYFCHCRPEYGNACPTAYAGERTRRFIGGLGGVKDRVRVATGALSEGLAAGRRA